MEEDFEFSQSSKNDVFEISKWMSRKLKVEIEPQSFLERPYRVGEFADGLKLVKIAETLLRKEIRGIERKPRTRGARVGNCKRAVDALFAGVGDIPAVAREGHRGVAEGNGPVIMEVLKTIKKKYDFKYV